MLDQATKTAIVERVRARMAAWYEGKFIEAACLYWAGMAIDELTRRGHRAILQAGTMQWPCVTHDDGVSPTHFSYVWDPGSPESTYAVMMGALPEMHVWAAIPADGEIIDVTTRYLPMQASRLAGLKWKGPTPPDYLWCGAAGLPKGVRYRPNRDATVLAVAFLAGKVL